MASPDGEDERRFLNYYRCEECSHEWTDEWSCQCDDTCPECGARDMSPYKSEDIDGDAP
jgi:rubrerythrin